MRHHLALFASLFAIVFTLQTLDAQEKPKGTDKPMTEKKEMNGKKDTVVIEILAENQHFRLHEELGTGPRFYYLWDKAS